MKRKFAIPLENQVLSEHFGGSEAFAFIDVEDNHVVQVQVKNAPSHVRGSYPAFLIEQGVTDVIAGSMGPHAFEMLRSAKVNVYLGAPIEAPEKLVQDFIAGKLQLSDNCCSHDHHHVHGHHHEH